MSDAPRKRSRFDMTAEDVRREEADRRYRGNPADPRRRRSRSPAPRDHGGSRRSRSPVSREKPSSPPANTAAAAAVAAAKEKALAAAAKISADLAAKKAAGLIPSVSSPNPIVRPGSETPSETKSKNMDIYEQDGDFIKDIEVNDLRNRYTLTKGPFQKMIMEKTGADVTTRGAYYPDKAMATAANPPLYLHITSRTKDGLEKALEIIDDHMKQDLPNLIDERRFPRNRREPEVERDERGRRKWPDEKIPIRLEPIHGFNIRAAVVGGQGANVKHIQQESGARVQIKGRGSGFYEHDTGVESDEPMYLHVTAPQQTQVDAAKALCLELLEAVTQNYEEAKENGGQRRGGFGNRDGGYRDAGYHNNNNNHNNNNQEQYSSYGGQTGYNNNSAQYGGAAQSYDQQYASTAQPPGDPQTDPTWWAYFAQLWESEKTDAQAFHAWIASNQAYALPYAAFKLQSGQWLEARHQQAAAEYAALSAPGYESAPGNEGSAYGQQPPPPPPGEAEAPPPPPPSGYNAVPPPPGL
ncbi:hypothetical protein ANO11243_022400 [Dothideomycetidae sp. 11243]|nr:hypothetical protein ANO11243_022400 [fungal sp. No.11243]